MGQKCTIFFKARMFLAIDYSGADCTGVVHEGDMVRFISNDTKTHHTYKLSFADDWDLSVNPDTQRTVLWEFTV